MRIFQPDSEEVGLSTSFTFEDKDEQNSFTNWLNTMDISFLKSKIPIINDGVLSTQVCVIINTPEENDEQVEVNEEVIELAEESNEIREEEKPKKKKKQKKEEINE